LHRLGCLRTHNICLTISPIKTVACLISLVMYRPGCIFKPSHRLGRLGFLCLGSIFELRAELLNLRFLGPKNMFGAKKKKSSKTWCGRVAKLLIMLYTLRGWVRIFLEDIFLKCLVLKYIGVLSNVGGPGIVASYCPNMLFIQTCCSSKHVVHPNMLFIQTCCSSKHVVHPNILFIQTCCSSKHVVHPNMLFIQTCCSSKHVVHRNMLFIQISEHLSSTLTCL